MGCRRSDDRAGRRGGARADKPRWVRILAIAVGLRMAAMIFKVPPQWGQCSAGEEAGEHRRG